MYIKTDTGGCVLRSLDRTALPSTSSSDGDDVCTTKQLKSVVVDPQKKTSCKSDDVSSSNVNPSCTKSSSAITNDRKNTKTMQVKQSEEKQRML